MSVDAVLDTNIFLYALSKAPEEAAKSEIAKSLITSVCFGVPMQVIQEFFFNAHSKARLCISMEDSSRMVSAMIQRPIILTDLDLFDEAKKMTFSYSLSYWDAAIVAATHRFKAPLLYSEDLSHGQHYGKVQVINPFAEL